MKQLLATDTLAFQLGMRPAVQFIDMSETPLKEVVASMSEFFSLSNLYDWVQVPSTSEPLKGDPEIDALVFYCLNHAVSMIRQRVHPIEPLGKYMPILDLFHREAAVRGARLFYYMMLICPREARHEHGGSKMPGICSKYGVPQSFVKAFPDSSSSALTYFVGNCPDIQLGPFVKFLSEQFYHGSYGSSFGGPKWGVVADCLRDYCIGKTTLELLLDTGFTLAHNTAPIFNKGMLYSPNYGNIIEILDVQRSGQIPQYIASGHYEKAKNPRVQGVYALCSSLLGEEFSAPGYVDWFKVEALGAEGTYSTEKAAQAKKYGTPKNVNVDVLAKVKKPSMMPSLDPDADDDSDDLDSASDTSNVIKVITIYPGKKIFKVLSPRKAAPTF